MIQKLYAYLVKIDLTFASLQQKTFKLIYVIYILLVLFSFLLRTLNIINTFV